MFEFSQKEWKFRVKWDRAVGPLWTATCGQRPRSVWEMELRVNPIKCQRGQKSYAPNEFIEFGGNSE